jgi:hypothetical protein
MSNLVLRELDMLSPELSVCIVAGTYDRARQLALLSERPNTEALAPAMAMTGRVFDVVLVVEPSILIFYHHWVAQSLLTRIKPAGKLTVLMQ